MTTIPIHPPLASSARQPSTRVTLIVMHATAGGGIHGSIASLRKKGLGYHYLIERNGSVYKGCPASRRTAHAGSSYGPHEANAGVDTAQYPNTPKNRAAGRVYDFVAGTSVNEYSIGIAFCNLNDGQEPITQAQLDAASELIAALKQQFADIEWISTHYEVSPQRKTDPRQFDLNAFATRVGLKAWTFARA